MISITRAALAALMAFGLSACTTTLQTKETASSAPQAPAARAVETNASTDMTESTSETLLYGAMTKFELMSFVEAVNTAQLQSALESNEPMTIFAPNNQAFEYARLGPNADIASLLKGHIVPGAMNVAALKAAVAENGAPVKLMSKAGTELTVYVMGGDVKVTGPNGALATLTQADMIQSNGVMHQISSVLKPK